MKFESSTAHEAFVHWCKFGQGSRSLTRVAKDLGRKLPQISHWCKKYRWQERGALYDIEFQSNLKLRQEVRLHRAQEDLAIAGRRVVREHAKDPTRAKLYEGVSAIAQADKMHRLDAGKPTEIVAVFAAVASYTEQLVTLVGDLAADLPPDKQSLIMQKLDDAYAVLPQEVQAHLDDEDVQEAGAA